MKPKSKGVTTAELAAELEISVKTLYRLLDSGVFRKKNYWLVNPTARRNTYRWNASGCKEDFLKAGKGR